MQATATRALMKSEIDRIEEMDKVRNGKINENYQCMRRIEKETFWARWVGKNAKLALIIFIVSVALILMGFNAINVRRTVEKMTDIELKDK